jgi:hypothetical protein
MFALLHSDINSPKSGFLHLTGQPYCKKSRSAKVKDGIIYSFLRNNLIDRYSGRGSDGGWTRTLDLRVTRQLFYHCATAIVAT